MQYTPAKAMDSLDASISGPAFGDSVQASVDGGLAVSSPSASYDRLRQLQPLETKIWRQGQAAPGPSRRHLQPQPQPRQQSEVRVALSPRVSRHSTLGQCPGALQAMHCLNRCNGLRLAGLAIHRLVLLWHYRHAAPATQQNSYRGIRHGQLMVQPIKPVQS